MRKFVLFAITVCTVSVFSFGCASTADWCKRGSWSPFSRPTVEAPEEIYLPAASTSYAMPACCDPCATIDPCGSDATMVNDPGPMGAYIP